MIEVTVKVNFPDECRELLTTKDVAALVIPVTPEELMSMRQVVAAIRGHLAFNAKCMRTARQTLDESGDPEKHLLNLVNQMFEPSQVAADIFENLCQLLARAVARNLNFNAEGKQ